MYQKNPPHFRWRQLTLLAILLAFLVPPPSLIAQNDPCNCAQRPAIGGDWNVDGTVDETGMNAVLLCDDIEISATVFSSATNCVYDPTDFTIDYSGITCLNLYTGANQNVDEPQNGCSIIWLNFDVRQYAGNFQFSLESPSFKVGYAMYYSNAPTSGLNGNLSGDCNALTLLGCGEVTDFPPPRANLTIDVPEFTEATNIYLAIWDQNSDSDLDCADGISYDFFASSGCGDGTCFLDSTSTAVKTCVGPNYTVTLPIAGINGTFTVTDNTGNALSIVTSPDPLTFNNLGDPSPVVTGSVTLTYPSNVAYDFTITEETDNTCTLNAIGSGINCDLQLDCSDPDLQDMFFSRRSEIPPADESLVAILYNPYPAGNLNIVVEEPDNGKAGCTTDTLVVTRRYIVTVDDGAIPPGDIQSDTCTQVFTIVNTALGCHNLINLTLDENCEAVVPPCMLISDPKACCMDFTVMIGTCKNIGTDCPAFPSNTVDGTYLGDTLYVKVTDPLTGINCWGRIYLEDKLDPVLECGADTVSCTENISPDSLGFPIADGPTIIPNGGGTYTVSGSACDSLTLSYRDRPGATSCTAQFGQIIYRDWTAQDLSGNQTRCTDTIRIERAGLADIRMPPNYDGFDLPPISCTDSFPMLANGFPDTSFTGSPTGMGCFNILFNYRDDPSDIYDVCGGTRKLVRRWTFLDWCAGSVADSFQIIKIEDANPPSIVCPGDVVAPTSPGTCQGSLDLPRPTITDSCSGTYYTVSLNPQEGTLSQLNDSTYHISNLDTGTYVVTYFAYDSCGNSDTCMYNLTIEDQFPPQAICDSVTVAPLNIDGISRVPAKSFDDGSYDDCNDVYFKVRRMTIGECSGLNGDDDLIADNYQEYFDDTLKMCCDDVGNPVLVIFRVYDVDPGLGPVDESRHQAGGDLFGHFSDCMITARTQDKIMPDLTAPADLTVNCSALPAYDLNDTMSMNAAFGSAVFSDDCGNATLTQSATASGTCPSDTITRAFLAVDQQNNQVRDTQRIVVETTATITDISQITFPPDTTVRDCRFGLEDTGELILPAGNNCTLIDSMFTDDTTYLDNGVTCPYYIDRTWTVIEVCPVSLNMIGVPFTKVQRINIFDRVAPITTMTPGTVFTFDANNDPNASFTFTARELDSKDNNNTPRTFDNCTPYPQLKFHFRDINVNDSMRTIGCGGLDREVMVDFAITDQCDNTELINSNTITVRVINCPVNRVAGGIIGNILSEAGEGVEEVIVQLTDQAGHSQDWETGANGFFRFPDLIADQSYKVRPIKQGGTRNGVSTFDLVMISKHITGQQQLPTPYQRIAADINNSGNISTFDIVELRKVILYINTTFPTNDSWRFVEEDFVFPASDPFVSTFPEVFEVAALRNPVSANFVAMKVGDVNGSAQANAQAPAQTRSYAGTVNLEFGELMLKEGQEYLVPIRSADIRALSGFEFALQFDPDAVSYLGMESGALPDLTAANIGQALLEEGILVTSWHHATPVSIDDDAVLFYLRFSAKQQVPLHHILSLNTDFTETEAYRLQANGEIDHLRIQLAEQATEKGFALFQNQPNPFRGNTLIGFRLPEASKARLTIYDVGGKMVKLVDGEYSAGYHEIELQKTELTGGGVLYYRLDTPRHSAVKKMTLMD